jgi:hypothetical protein
MRFPLLLVRFLPIVGRFFSFRWWRRLRFRLRRRTLKPLWGRSWIDRPRLGLRWRRFRRGRRGRRSPPRCRRCRRLRRGLPRLDCFPRRFGGSYRRGSGPCCGRRRPAGSCGRAFRLHRLSWWFTRDRRSRSCRTSRNRSGGAIRLRVSGLRLTCWSGASRNNWCDWLTCRHGLRLSDDRRTPLIHRCKLLTVLRCCLPLLQLSSHGRHALLVYCGSFHRQRLSCHSSWAIVAGAASCIIDRNVVDDDRICDCAVIHANVAGVYVVRRAVVIEAVSAPVPALIAGADVAESIINSAVIADVKAPVAVVIPVSAAGVSPIARSPQ